MKVRQVSEGFFPDRSFGLMILVFVFASFRGHGQTVLRVPGGGIPIVPGLILDLNEDGLADFEFQHLNHYRNGKSVTSVRIVGKTHIYYQGEAGENPILLHTNYHGHFESFAKLPGPAGRMLVLDPDQIIVGEVARVEPGISGQPSIRSYWNANQKTYLGLSVETLDGVIWGWAEISLIGNELFLTAYGYEATHGDVASIGGVPVRSEDLGLRIESSGAETTLIWRGVNLSSYQVEESSDCRNWKTIMPSRHAGAQGWLTAKLPVRHESERCFYRLVCCRN